MMFFKDIRFMIIVGVLFLVVLILFFPQRGVYEFIGGFITGKALIGYGDDSVEMLDVFVESDEIEKKEFNYYLIELSYVEDEFEIVDFSLEEGNLPVLERDDREFKIKLFSSEDELLYFNSFSNPGLVFSDGLITGGVIENEEVNFNVIIPNFEESYRFEILDGVEKKVLEVYLDDLN